MSGQPPGADLLIWWLSGPDCRAVLAWAYHDLPVYIRAELRSRAGRSGRGRLWISIDLGRPDLKAIDWPGPDHPIVRLIDASNLGGIVIRAEDFPAVAGLPGCVTTLDLGRHVR